MSMAMTMSVALTALLVVSATVLGVNTATAVSRQISVRRTHEAAVSSLAERCRMWMTISAIAHAVMITASATPAGQPSAGDSVHPFIVSASKRMRAIR